MEETRTEFCFWCSKQIIILDWKATIRALKEFNWENYFYFCSKSHRDQYLENSKIINQR